MATDHDSAEAGLNKQRAAILAAALKHVPFDGWTMATLDQGAVDAGFDATVARRVFPAGIGQAIAFHSAHADAAMLVALQDMDLPAMRVRDRVTTAVRIRLQQNEADRLALARAATVLALPRHAGLAARCLYRTVDAIWYACGDTATDYNFYTKRALLAGVYASTTLCWLNDRSPGCADTWAFLDRRIDNVMQVPKLMPKLKARLRRAASIVPSPVRFARAAADLRR